MKALFYTLLLSWLIGTACAGTISQQPFAGTVEVPDTLLVEHYSGGNTSQPVTSQISLTNLPGFSPILATDTNHGGGRAFEPALLFQYESYADS